MSLLNIVGIGASILTATSLLPQLVKIVKDKKADEISLYMLAILFAGVALWIYYGILKNDMIIVISNSVSLLFNIAVVILSVYYKQKK